MSPGYFDILNPLYMNFLDTYIINNAKLICTDDFSIITRNSKNFGSVSCRIWQLLYSGNSKYMPI